MGFQAHPEFCTRPLNPSPPFLGFVAASCGAQVLAEQLERQVATFVPPHPAATMVSEALLKSASEAAIEVHAVMPVDAENQHMKVVEAVNEDQ